MDDTLAGPTSTSRPSPQVDDVVGAADRPGTGVDPADSPARTASEPARLRLHMPVDVRSVSLGIIAFLACLFAMQWAKAVLIPVLLGIMLSYALTPLVTRLHRWRVPRAVGATVLLAAIVAGVGWGLAALSDQANALLETVPQVTQQLRHAIDGKRDASSTLGKVERAAVEIEAAANAQPSPSAAASGSDAASAPASAAHARTAPPAAAAPHGDEHAKVDVRGYLLSGTLGALAVLGQITVVFFIALFLLASGNSFRRKMVKLAGPRFSQKKVTIETLDEITNHIQRYLLVQLGISAIVGLATWLAFYAIGLKQSAVWGAVAAVTNLIPYVGAIFVGLGSTLFGFVQFGTASTALLIGASSFAIHTVIGNVLTPWWMGRASRMSPLAVFLAVLLFGWLWGVWGLLLGVPILLVVKSICDRVEDLKAIGELLGT